MKGNLKRKKRDGEVGRHYSLNPLNLALPAIDLETLVDQLPLFSAEEGSALSQAS